MIPVAPVSARLRRALLPAAALAATLLLGACASIPERAIVNGRAMGPQMPLQWRNVRDMSQLRSQYYEASPLKVRHRPYAPFGVWR